MILSRAVSVPRAVCVNDLAQARAAVACAGALRCGVVLLSAPGAAVYAGCGWWRALMAAAGAGGGDLLDCGDAAGYAMAALRIGQRGIVLDADTPALAAVRGAALVLGATVVTARPDHLDLAERGIFMRSPGLHQFGAEAMRLTFLALAVTAACPSLALAGTPGSFVVFNDIPQFGIYVSTPPDYTPPKGVYMNTNGTEFLTKLSTAERGKIGADVSATVEYLAQCDNYDRIGSLFMIVKPHGVIPTTSDPTIELVRWITPFSDYTQGQYATHTYPAASMAPFEGVMTDASKDVWIGIAGGSNPYSGDPCTNAGKSADFSAIGFSYSVSFGSTKPAVAQGSAVSGPVLMSDYTAVPVTGSAASSATGSGTALVIVSGHGSATGGDEYKHTEDTLSLNGAPVGTFSTEANCSSYAKFSPDGNPFIFRNNAGSNPRNWCPGALVPSLSFPVTLGADNSVSLGMSDPSVPAGSYYDTSVTLIKN